MPAAGRDRQRIAASRPLNDRRWPPVLACALAVAPGRLQLPHHLPGGIEHSPVIRGTLPGADAQPQALPLDRWRISAVTRSEQRFGVELTPLAVRCARAVDSFPGLAPVAPWDKAAADGQARLRAALQRTGTSIGVYDRMIAAHPLALGAVPGIRVIADKPTTPSAQTDVARHLPIDYNCSNITTIIIDTRGAP